MLAVITSATGMMSRFKIVTPRCEQVTLSSDLPITWSPKSTIHSNFSLNDIG
jgi:hypothetical protein